MKRRKALILTASVIGTTIIGSEFFLMGCNNNESSGLSIAGRVVGHERAILCRISIVSSLGECGGHDFRLLIAVSTRRIILFLLIAKILRKWIKQLKKQE